MTALTEFERLEAQGSWREAPDARLREVIVSLGDATLMLKDPASERPLAHWSLPAVIRTNPGRSPAVYRPRAEGPDEVLEIDDPLMIKAIDRVHRAIQSRRAHPGRLRGGLFLFAAILMAAAAVLWLPDAIIRHAAKVVPPAQARAVGHAVLADITRSTGEECQRRSGQAVLEWIAPKLFDEKAEIHVIPSPVNGARHLPGHTYILGSDILLSTTGPGAAAGHLIAAELALSDHEVLLDALEYAGAPAVLRLLTLGTLPEGALRGYGEQLLQRAAPVPEASVLLERFAEKGVPSGPYARSLDPTGQSTANLIEGDPFLNGLAPKPLLNDQQWLALQQICAG